MCYPPAMVDDQTTLLFPSHGQTTLDHTTVQLDGAAQSVHLFVPEIESETRFRSTRRSAITKSQTMASVVQ